TGTGYSVPAASPAAAGGCTADNGTRFAKSAVCHCRPDADTAAGLPLAAVAVAGSAAGRSGPDVAVQHAADPACAGLPKPAVVAPAAGAEPEPVVAVRPA